MLGMCVLAGLCVYKKAMTDPITMNINTPNLYNCGTETAFPTKENQGFLDKPQL